MSDTKALIYFLAGMASASIILEVLMFVNMDEAAVIFMYISTVIATASLSYILGKDTGEAQYRLKKIEEEQNP